MRQAVLILLIAASLPHELDGASLRQMKVAASPASHEQIKDKWEKMDDFLEVLFTMSCKWTHTKDIQGEAMYKLGQRKINRKDVTPFIAQRQGDNVKALKSVCDTSTNAGEMNCRNGCHGRWYGKAKEGTECSTKCVKTYQTFNERCRQQADHLEMVYEMGNQVAANKQKCHEDHCKAYPQIWEMDAQEAEQERENQCNGLCTANHVLIECSNQFEEETEVIRAQVGTDCHEASSERSCYNEKAKMVTEAKDTCRDDAAAACNEELNGCIEKNGQQGKAFCDGRFKACTKDSSKECHDTYTEGLNKAEGECKRTAENEFEACTKDTFAKKKEEFMGTCTEKEQGKCNKECIRNCDIEVMNQCVANNKPEHDPSEDFCTDFWRLLHKTYDVDPATGDPIVLLSLDAQKRLGF